jgi:hypothetical protein
LRGRFGRAARPVRTTSPLRPPRTLALAASEVDGPSLGTAAAGCGPGRGSPYRVEAIDQRRTGPRPPRDGCRSAGRLVSPSRRAVGCDLRITGRIGAHEFPMVRAPRTRSASNCRGVFFGSRRFIRFSASIAVRRGCSQILPGFGCTKALYFRHPD